MKMPPSKSTLLDKLDDLINEINGFDLDEEFEETEKAGEETSQEMVVNASPLKTSGGTQAAKNKRKKEKKKERKASLTLNNEAAEKETHSHKTRQAQQVHETEHFGKDSPFTHPTVHNDRKDESKTATNALLEQHKRNNSNLDSISPRSTRFVFDHGSVPNSAKSKTKKREDGSPIVTMKTTDMDHLRSAQPQQFGLQREKRAANSTGQKSKHYVAPKVEEIKVDELVNEEEIDNLINELESMFEKEIEIGSTDDLSNQITQKHEGETASKQSVISPVALNPQTLKIKVPMQSNSAKKTLSSLKSPEEKISYAKEKIKAVNAKKAFLRIYIGDLTSFHTIELTSVVSNRNVILNLKGKNIIPPSENWTIFEISCSFDIERPLLDSDKLLNVVEGWDEESENILMAKKFDFKRLINEEYTDQRLRSLPRNFAMHLEVPKESILGASTDPCQSAVSTKWKRRYLSIRQNTLNEPIRIHHASNTSSTDDQVLISSLDEYKIYVSDPAKLPKGSPSKNVLILKNKKPLSMFENSFDCLKIMSIDKAEKMWLLFSILLQYQKRDRSVPLPTAMVQKSLKTRSKSNKLDKPTGPLVDLNERIVKKIQDKPKKKQGPLVSL